jgi:hypothetical protein
MKGVKIIAVFEGVVEDNVPLNAEAISLIFGPAGKVTISAPALDMDTWNTDRIQFFRDVGKAKLTDIQEIKEIDP